MAMTMDEIDALLREIGLKYRRHDDTNRFTFGFTTRDYVAPDGAKALMVGVELLENGEYLNVCAPRAFVAKGPHTEILLKACMMAQWMTKLVQFEYDDQDGEIRPTVEFPIEDSKVTARQLARSVRGLVELTDKLYPVFSKALSTGQISFPDQAPPPEMIAELEHLLETLKRRRAEAAPDGV